MAPEFAPRKLVQLLASYEGVPEVALFRIGTELLLGVAVDDDDDEGLVRWIEAPITEVERDALYLGALTVRDALQKAWVWIVDRRHDFSVAGMSPRNTADLDDDLFPMRGALLPTSTRAELAPTVIRGQAPRLRLDGGSVRDHEIAMKDLAEFGGAFQTLWTSIAQTVLEPTATRLGAFKKRIRERSQLYVSPVPGSFGLQIEPADNELSNRVMPLLSDLLAASDNRERLLPAIARLRVRAASNYSRLLKLLADSRLNVLVDWQGTVGFIGADTAARVRDVLERSSPARREQVDCVGYFSGFSTTTNRFDFYDYITDELLSGRVAPEVVQRVLEDRLDVKIGASVVYHAQLAALSWEGVEAVEYELVNVWVVPENEIEQESEL